MRSASSSSDESEMMFPSADVPPLEQSIPSAGIFASGLSPPTSQDPPEQNGYGGFQEDQMDLEVNDPSIDGGKKEVVESKGPSRNINSSQAFSKDHNEGSGDLRHQPGYAWNNKRAVYEYEKAMQHVADPHFNLSEHWLT